MGELVNRGASFGKKICIVCQKDVAGLRALPVREDRVIKAIRGAKTVLGQVIPFLKPQNNQLFVCEACMPKHVETRRSFEKVMLFASIVAALMVLLLIYSVISSGRFDAWVIVSALIVAVFMLALPLFRYTPAVEEGTVQQPTPLPGIAPGPAEPEQPEEKLPRESAPKAKRRR